MDETKPPSGSPEGADSSEGAASAGASAKVSLPKAPLFKPPPLPGRASRTEQLPGGSLGHAVTDAAHLKKPEKPDDATADASAADEPALPGETRDAPAPAPEDPARPMAAKQSMADLLVGSVLADRYELIEKVGEGAMGWVFLAKHTEIGKKCAIKVLRPALCRLPEAVSRFRREARSAAGIGSEHIADVTDFGTTPNGAVFFAMELLEGEDLGTMIAREGGVPWPRARDMVLQMCVGLQVAHDQGIIHRDVKPANFFRCTRGDNEDFIKILDFGIARLSNNKDSIVTQTGVVMGTPDYMAPEQAQGRHVDHLADVYSLGATLYALLTGRPPFVGANEYDVIYKQLNDEPEPPSTHYTHGKLPKSVDALILRALAKDAADRFETMKAFAEALRNPEASTKSEAKPDDAGSKPKSEDAPKRKSARPVGTAAARAADQASSPMVTYAVIALVVAGLAWVVYTLAM